MFQGFTSLPPLPMTRGHSHSLGIEVHDPGNSLGDRQEIHNIPPGMPQSEVGPNGGTSPATPPLEAGRYMTRGPANSFDAPEHMMGQWRREDGRPVFANPKPNCPRAVQHGWGESTTVHQFPINYGQKTPSPSQAHGAPALLDIYSDDRPHQNGVKYGPHLQVLNMSRPDNLGPVSKAVPYIVAGSDTIAEFIYHGGSQPPAERSEWGDNGYNLVCRAFGHPQPL